MSGAQFKLAGQEQTSLGDIGVADTGADSPQNLTRRCQFVTILLITGPCH